MAYNKDIEARVNAIAASWPKSDQKKMFGGVCYLINGNMVCGIINNDLILRLGAAEAEEAALDTVTKPFAITGRPMKGWVMVAEQGFQSAEALKAWLHKAKTFTETLPPK